MKTKTIGYRLTEEEVAKLNEIAISLNFFYGGKPCFTKVLREIAKGNLIISQKIT
jgi:hypothetical protein